MSESKPRFIRRNGKIIPIGGKRKKKEKKPKGSIEGAGVKALGVGIGAAAVAEGSNRLRNKELKRAMQFGERSRVFDIEADLAPTKEGYRISKTKSLAFESAGQSSFSKASKLNKLTKVSKTVSAGMGAFFVGAAAGSMLKSLLSKKKKKKK